MVLSDLSPGVVSVRPLSSAEDLGDMATTIDAEDGFDLAGCSTIAGATLLIAGGRHRFDEQALLEEDGFPQWPPLRAVRGQATSVVSRLGRCRGCTRVAFGSEILDVRRSECVQR